MRIATFCCLLLALVLAAPAQTIDGFFETQINAGAGTGGADQYQVTLQLKASEAVDLGSSTLRLTYNPSVLAIPSGATAAQDLTEGTDYTFEDFNDQYVLNTDPLEVATYTSSDATRASTGELSVNIVLSSTGIGKSLGTAFTDVIVLTFDVLTSGNPLLNWQTSTSTPTEFFAEDNTTPLTLGSFSGDTTPLPVELVAFTARASGFSVDLRWQTLSEQHNRGFEIEWQAAPALTWTTLAQVPSQAEGAGGAAYAYTAEALVIGTHRFRLKQVDLDGRFTYSPQVEVEVTLPEGYQLSAVYPNPFNPQAQFTLALAATQPVEIALYDLLGRRVALLHQGELVGQKTHTFTVEGQALASGLYFLRVQGRSFQRVRSLTLLK